MEKVVILTGAGMSAESGIRMPETSIMDALLMTLNPNPIPVWVHYATHSGGVAQNPQPREPKPREGVCQRASFGFTVPPRRPPRGRSSTPRRG